MQALKSVVLDTLPPISSSSLRMALIHGVHESKGRLHANLVRINFFLCEWNNLFDLTWKLKYIELFYFRDFSHPGAIFLSQKGHPI